VTRLAAVLLAPALLLVAAPAAPIPKEKPQTPYYPTQKGAKWVYHFNGDDAPLVVTGVEEKDGAVIVSEEFRTNLATQPVVRTKVSVSGKGLFLVAALDRAVDPPIGLLKLPHKPGNKWENTGRNPDRTETCTAFGPEEVEVPAGKYQAIRVEAEFAIGGKPYRSTAWYAPGVGLVRKVHPDGEVQVLKSFTPGKD
jgi:hypothetical protein